MGEYRKGRGEELDLGANGARGRFVIGRRGKVELGGRAGGEEEGWSWKVEEKRGMELGGRGEEEGWSWQVEGKRRGGVGR